MQQQITEFLSNIYPTKIIMIKSGSYDYMPLDLTTHTGLYLPNNRGKTSIINAAKIQLFNEVNFKDAGRKFGFIDPEGKAYTGHASYNYFFKSTQSFNIGEYHDSDNGNFCQIVYRGNTSELEVNRVFVRCTYEQIKHIFVNENDAPRYIDKDRMIQKLHETGFEMLHLYGTKNTRKNVGSVLYDLFGNNQGTKPFCVLPLKDPNNEASIATAKKNIINLLAGKLSAEDIQKQIIDLITAQAYSKNQENDGGHSAAEFLSKFESANNLKTIIQDIESRQESFEKVSENYTTFKSCNTDLHRTVEEANFWLNDRLMDLREEQSVVEGEINSYSEELTVLKTTEKELTQKVVATETRKTDLEKEISNTGIAADKAKRLIQAFCDKKDIVAEYNNSDFVEKVVDSLIKKFKHDRDTVKQGIENQNLLPEKESEKADLIKRHAKISNQMKSIEQKIKEVRQIINSKSESMLSSMPEEKRIKLFSLHNSFASLPNNNDKLSTTLSELADQIEINAGQIKINGLSFGDIAENIDFEEVLSEHHALLNEKRESLQNTESKIVEINSEIEVIKKLATGHKTENVIATYSNHIKSLQGFQSNCEKIEELTANLEQKAEELAQLEEVYAESAEKLDSVLAEVETLNAKKTDVGYKINKFLHHMQSLQDHDEKLDLIPQQDTDSKIDLGDDNIESVVKSCKERIDLATNSINEFKDEMAKSFATCNTFFSLSNKEDMDLSQAIYSQEEAYHYLDDLYEKVATRFKALPDYEVNYQDEVRVLNDAIQASIKQIRDVNHLISLAVNKINEMLSGRKISNLTSVKIDYIPSGLYETIEHISNRDFFSESVENLVSEDIIQNINNAFLANGRVDIDSLIDKVKISYRKTKNKEEDQTQSNGTTVIIAIYINSLLLKDSLSKDINKFHFPVFIDECNTIDENNIVEIVDLIKEFGFTAILAGPQEQYIAKTLVDKTIHGSYAFDVMDDETLRYNRFAEEKFLELLASGDYDLADFTEEDESTEIVDPIKNLKIPARKSNSLFEENEV